MELVELGTTGPHEVLHRPVHRDKVLGASVGQGQSHPPAWGTNMHNKTTDQEAEIPEQGPKDLST